MEDGGRRGGQSDARGEGFDLLIFKMEEGAMSQRMQQPLERHKVYYPLEPLDRKVS